MGEILQSTPFTPSRRKALDPVANHRVYVDGMDGLTRGQLAQRAQMNLETIRFYESEGLLPPPPRTASGYRKYSEASVERLAFVKRAKTLGFSLEEIRVLLSFQDHPVDACAEVRGLVLNKLADIRDKKAELEKLETQLSGALRKCNRALKQQRQHPGTCPVLNQMVHPDARNGEPK